MVLRTKKELPVLEYIDRGYVVTFYRPNDCAVTPAIHLRWHRTATYHRQTDSAAMPAITILIAPIHLRSTDQIIVPVRLRSTDRLTDRRALRSTYYYHVDFRLLRLQQTYPRCLTRSRLNRLLLLPPAAKPVPYCLPTPPQAQRKNCQWWNIWTKVT